MSASGLTLWGVGLGVLSLWLAGSTLVMRKAEIAVGSARLIGQLPGAWDPEQSISTQTSISSSRVVGKVGVNVCKALSSQWVCNK